MSDKFWAWVIGVIIVLGVVGVVWSVSIQDRKLKIERDGICKSIGEKLDLEFYGRSVCRGFDGNCDYKCKFIDNNGEIVVKNVK